MLDGLFSGVSAVYVIGACLCASAFFSATETAITSLGFIKVKLMLEDGGRGTRGLRLWLRHPSRVITTILLYNNVVNIFASAITTTLAQSYTNSNAVGLATGITTFWVLVFGEIIPKSFAKAYAERLAPVAMQVIELVYWVSFPLVWLLSQFADWVIRLVSGGAMAAPLITEAEIEMAVVEGQKAGVLGQFKRDLIERAFEFDETVVREIMTPRTDVVAFDINTPMGNMVDTMLRTGHSRVPVYCDSIDQIQGLVLIKDLIAKIGHSDGGWRELGVADLLREAHFIPDTKPIIEVFKDLRRTKNHMSIIIDEYGGTAGVVTMEDILEEIVGEIQDEHDVEDAKISRLADGTVLVAGGTHIAEFFEYFDVDRDDLDESQRGEGVETVAGWVTGLTGEMPRVGRHLKVGPFTVEVMEVENRRINKVKVEFQGLIPPVKEDDDSGR